MDENTKVWASICSGDKWAGPTEEEEADGSVAVPEAEDDWRPDGEDNWEEESETQGAERSARRKGGPPTPAPVT